MHKLDFLLRMKSSARNSKTLGKNWNFNVDHNSSWQTRSSQEMPLYNNTLFCDCISPDGVCHVLKIRFLKGQDLAGVLPPAIVKLPYLKTLNLTRNYLSGNIPPKWASSKLEYLSLVVNRLTGNIPSYFGEMTSLIYLNLENNLFYGFVPPELGHLVNMVNIEIDLSYNNFTESSLPSSCGDTLNLVKSTSRVNDSKPMECLNSFACSEDRYSVHINCSEATTIGSISYEADEEVGAAAKYIPYRETWEISTTGLSWDKNRSASDYIPQNLSTLRMSNSQLYPRAHIVLRDNSSFYSLGKQIFDVYIQEKRVWKDFSVVNEAQEVDKVVIKDFKVSVKDGTIVIRFQMDRIIAPSIVLEDVFLMSISRRNMCGKRSFILQR